MTSIPADTPVELTDEQKARCLLIADRPIHAWADNKACEQAMAEGIAIGRASAPEVTRVSDEEAESPVAPGWTYTVGDGHDGFGCYAHNTDYPEEGAVKIASGSAPEVTRESRAVEAIVLRQAIASIEEEWGRSTIPQGAIRDAMAAGKRACLSTLRELLADRQREARKDEARWISVSEQLPNVGETVVVLDRGVVGIGRKANDDDDSLMWLDIESVDRDGDYNDTYGVTHWMPLPAPPAALQTEQPEGS